MFYYINMENLYIQIIFPYLIFIVKISPFILWSISVCSIQLNNYRHLPWYILEVMVFVSHRHLKVWISSFSEDKKINFLAMSVAN